MQKSTLKRILNLAGHILAIAGVVFVAFRLNEFVSQIDLSRLDNHRWIAVAVLSGLYGTANGLLALAWRHLLSFLGTNTSRYWAVRAYGLSQLAKYVPGNICHIASRQALGLAAGLPGWAVIKSIFFELVLIASIGALFGSLITPLFWPGIATSVAFLAFFAILGITICTMWFRFGRDLALAALYQAIFLGVSGSVFAAVLALLIPEVATIAILPITCGSFVIAWLVGLITPGAPAGVGLREFMLLWLLGDIIVEPTLLLAIVLTRIATVSGDLLFFFFAKTLPTCHKEGVEKYHGNRESRN